MVLILARRSRAKIPIARTGKPGYAAVACQKGTIRYFIRPVEHDIVAILVQ